MTPREREIREMKELVDKFLSWPLPDSVRSDICVTMRDYPYVRSGTNLLTASEAEQMFQHLVGPLLAQLTTAREVIEVAKGSMEFSQTMIEHALAFDYLGEGPTNGMAKDAVAKLEAALAKITEMEKEK